MRRLTSILVWMALVLGGCFGTESTNPPGPRQCEVDAECGVYCDALAADLAAQSDAVAEVRSATCDETTYYCRCVTRSRDACFVDWSLDPLDCGLSDEDLIEAHDEARPSWPSCDEPGTSGTCVEERPHDGCTHPRDPDEWQGMLVDMCSRALCDVSSRCGLAAACLDDGMCGPCSADADCADGEACVLDYCVRSELVGCRTRHDCSGELCVLSGITGGTPRGNEDMRSYCSGSDTPPPRE